MTTLLASCSSCGQRYNEIPDSLFSKLVSCTENECEGTVAVADATPSEVVSQCQGCGQRFADLMNYMIGSVVKCPECHANLLLSTPTPKKSAKADKKKLPTKKGKRTTAARPRKKVIPEAPAAADVATAEVAQPLEVTKEDLGIAKIDNASEGTMDDALIENVVMPAPEPSSGVPEVSAEETAAKKAKAAAIIAQKRAAREEEQAATAKAEAAEAAAQAESKAKQAKAAEWIAEKRAARQAAAELNAKKESVADFIAKERTRRQQQEDPVLAAKKEKAADIIAQARTKRQQRKKQA